MHISVILCTWNNCNRLKITLEAISQCFVPPGVKWELIVVNNNCTDETDRVVCEFYEVLPVRCIKEPKQGLSRAKNTGLAVASGELVIWTDDDVKPCKGWIASYWESYQNKPDGFFFGGPVKSEFEIENPDEDLLKCAPASVKGLDFGMNQKILNVNEKLLSANWACSLKNLKLVGGFNQSLGLGASAKNIRVGEETDIMDRLNEKGLKPWYIPDGLVNHFVPKEKITVMHIASRIRANGYYNGYQDYQNFNKTAILRQIKYFSYLLFHSLRLVKFTSLWLFRLFTGEKGYIEYFKIIKITEMLKIVFLHNK